MTGGTGKSPRRQLWALGLGLFAVLSLQGAAHAQDADASAATYVGSSECADCHEEQVLGLGATQHGKQAFADLSQHSCETCHGPLSNHVKNPRSKKFYPLTSLLSTEEKNAACQQCHDGGAQSHWAGSAHETRGLACQDCHSVHSFRSPTGQLKAESVMESCFECHKDVRAQTRKTSHHPIREGKVGCEDCHNPHGTLTPGLITAASVNDQCYECHAEKRGPFLWEHAPVRENCMNCHTPHGSNHQKLQITSVPYLCQQCHSNTRHPGTLYDGTTLPAEARQSNRIFNRGCVNCHANIHGSNHPSGPYLGR